MNAALKNIVFFLLSCFLGFLLIFDISGRRTYSLLFVFDRVEYGVQSIRPSTGEHNIPQQITE